MPTKSSQALKSAVGQMFACTRRGHYFLTNKDGARIPVLHSTVGYMGIPDGGDPRGKQSLWAWSKGAAPTVLLYMSLCPLSAFLSRCVLCKRNRVLPVLGRDGLRHDPASL